MEDRSYQNSEGGHHIPSAGYYEGNQEQYQSPDGMGGEGKLFLKLKNLQACTPMKRMSMETKSIMMKTRTTVLTPWYSLVYSNTFIELAVGNWHKQRH